MSDEELVTKKTVHYMLHIVLVDMMQYCVLLAYQNWEKRSQLRSMTVTVIKYIVILSIYRYRYIEIAREPFVWTVQKLKCTNNNV